MNRLFLKFSIHVEPGKKNASKESYYRPISLQLPAAHYKRGFRKMHSTTTALTAITTRTSQGLNQQRPCERTILVALDLSKAFDTVSHATLFQDILLHIVQQHEEMDCELSEWSSIVRGV